jgi:hypothetical protein
MDDMDDIAPAEGGTASAGERYRVAFVMEQMLGHRTHAQNLLRARRAVRRTRRPINRTTR